MTKYYFQTGTYERTGLTDRQLDRLIDFAIRHDYNVLDDDNDTFVGGEVIGFPIATFGVIK